MARLQSALGRINDFRTAGEIVARTGNYKRIEAALKQRRRTRLSAFRKLWQADFDATGAEKLGRTFRFSRSKRATRGTPTRHTAGAAAGASLAA
jgi:hypothetical protein